MNRGDTQEIEEINVQLTRQLIESVSRNEGRPHIIFSSSVQAGNESAYGTSKQKCTELLEAWSAESGGKAAILSLPHVFGEHGKPFYNSVVSTFCYQLARGEQPNVINDSNLELIHAQDLADRIIDIISTGASGTIRLEGKKITVSQLLSNIPNTI